jgi:hypothetical protein
MDALFRGIFIVGVLASTAAVSIAAPYTTPNFIVNAPTAEFAKQVGDAAEAYRRDLAIEWTGKPLPHDWSSPCPITVVVGNMGAGGKTTFNFQAGQVYGWKMEIRGTEQRILDSVLPHEINHTIFATVFRRPLPRWADEGAASLIEHESERNQLRQIHSRAINAHRKIPLKTLLDIKQYPQDQQEVLTLYAEGHSLADFLIQRGGKQRYLNLMEMAYNSDWETALKSLYGFAGVDKLEREWDQWVMAGSHKIPEGTLVAGRDRSSATEPTIRGQSPASEVKLSEPVQLASSETIADREARDGQLQEFSDDEQIAQASTRLKRNRLIQPLLTIDKTTTDAAKIPQTPAKSPYNPQN